MKVYCFTYKIEELAEKCKLIIKDVEEFKEW